MTDYHMFVVFALGFFTAITTLIWLLTYLEQTLLEPGSQKRPDIDPGNAEDQRSEDLPAQHDPAR